MTRIIGHRGASGLALENSVESLRSALQYALDAVELDVRRTKDGQLVIMHDRNTRRVSDKNVAINQLTLKELRDMTLKNGQVIPTLEEAFKMVSDQALLVIDIKDTGIAPLLLDLLKRYPKVRIEVTSLKHKELRDVRTARPDIPALVLEHFSPFEIIHKARRLHAQGISLNMWLMNPLTYRLAKRYGLELRVYTVNSPLLMRFFKKLYPDVTIYTDHPQRFVNKQRKRSVKAKQRR